MQPGYITLTAEPPAPPASAVSADGRLRCARVRGARFRRSRDRGSRLGRGRDRGSRRRRVRRRRGRDRGAAADGFAAAGAATADVYAVPADPPGVVRYSGEVPLDRPGSFGYTVRVLPRHPLLDSRAELGLVTYPQAPAGMTNGDLR